MSCNWNEYTKDGFVLIFVSNSGTLDYIFFRKGSEIVNILISILHTLSRHLYQIIICSGLETKNGKY